MTKVKELYTCVGQEGGPEVVFTDKEDVLISNLHKIMPATHRILSVWHINKNIQSWASKYFSEKELYEAYIELWHKVCKAATLAEYNSARSKLGIGDPPLIEENGDILFWYSDR